MVLLTDDELSRVMTACATGELSYWSTATCVGGFAVVTDRDGSIHLADHQRFWELSAASCQFHGSDYPSRTDPDGFLAFLEERGLA